MIGNSGNDYSYNLTDKVFENSADGKNISYTEIADISAIFLVAEIDNNNAVIAGHDTEIDFNTKNNTLEILRDDDTDIHPNVYGGKFWIGGNEKTIADFDRVNGSIIVYGLRTSGAGAKANQIMDKNISDRVWKGKYQKYIIFDKANVSSTIKEAEAAALAKFLDDNK